QKVMPAPSVGCVPRRPHPSSVLSRIKIGKPENVRFATLVRSYERNVSVERAEGVSDNRGLNVVVLAGRELNALVFFALKGMRDSGIVGVGNAVIGVGKR